MTILTRRLLIGFAAALTAGAPALAATTSQMAAAIDHAARASVQAGETPGLQIAVYKDGRPVLVKGYGLASIELRVPVSNDSVFRIGSVTKQFVAAAILKLQEEGRLSVDDHLSRFYPNFPRAKDITLRQMLNHTSGIHDHVADPEAEAEMCLRATTDQIVAHLAALPKTQDFEPGTDWSYSNSAYDLLGGVVEKVSGQSVGAFLKAQFFEPLGMTRTAVDDEAEIVPDRAAGYEADVPGKFRNAALFSAAGAGGSGSMRSNASDLVKWNAALFGGKVLTPASLAAMTAPGKLNDGSNSGKAMLKRYAHRTEGEYGLGLDLDVLEGHRRIDHGGRVPGFHVQLTEFPDDHVTVAVLSNASGYEVGAKVSGKIERMALALGGR